MSPKTVYLPVPARIVDRLPAEPGERERIVEPGVRELRIQEALAAFARGACSLAFAARKADIPLREMIPSPTLTGSSRDWLRRQGRGSADARGGCRALTMVVDAGPLIALAKTGGLETLFRLHPRVLIPPAVRDEAIGRLPSRRAGARGAVTLNCSPVLFRRLPYTPSSKLRSASDRPPSSFKMGWSAPKKRWSSRFTGRFAGRASACGGASQP